MPDACDFFKKLLRNCQKSLQFFSCITRSEAPGSFAKMLQTIDEVVRESFDEKQAAF